jgi:hypothetical protein
MNGQINTERVLDAYLAPEADRLPDRVLDAALADIARTPQRRAMRVPWRFPTMPALTRATGIAAVALVAVVGAGTLISLNTRGPGDPGGPATASPTPTPGPTAEPTAEPTVASTPSCSEVAAGICGWKTYTSAVYDYTMSYPDDWVVGGQATEEWQPDASEDAPNLDIFGIGDGDTGIAFFALQFPAPTAADLGSWDGLLAAIAEMCSKPTEFLYGTCPSEDLVTPMCLGSPGCRPVAFVHENGESPRALFGDPDTGIVTYIQMGRVDEHPSAARYGGSVMLLKAILDAMDVREPQPGETPQ